MAIDTTRLGEDWKRLMAPATGDLRGALVAEAAEFLDLTLDEAWERLSGAGTRLRDEWNRSIADPTDAAAVEAFYNQSDTELFELIEWHASDPIHYRTLVLRDYAAARPGRACLDYGSGIGSDAIVFGTGGFHVTLADVSDVLLAFAAFRCRKRGLKVGTIDLKHDELPDSAFDVALCLDVLEHIPKPLTVVRRVRQALAPHGLFVVHAPFGDDPEHPMHVVHRDVVTPRIRSLGYRPVDCPFPTEVRAPLIYSKEDLTIVDRAGYYLYDGYLNNAVGAAIAAWYRRTFRVLRPHRA